ncbi:MAG: formate dehydrogenase subunit alpha [Rhodospirillaceae bacterium]|nr:formate dehydrogenase subunit alpha [Rhodospirillaceae bacterium]
MTEQIAFTLDGREVAARPGETIWQVAEREGIVIPHLCHRPKPGYRPDGNCRACMVEVAGERTLAASCIRTPRPGMVVSTESARAQAARAMVFELLLADQPPRHAARDADSTFWGWADRIGLTESRLPSRDTAPAPDRSHPAMAVHLDACIQCNLCVRACREVQVNDVIGMALRGHDAKIVFDFDDPMGASTCVGCGECVQACPTGALMPATVMNADGRKDKVADRTVDTLCPYCGVGCQTRLHIKDDRVLFAEGRDGPSNTNRLCVKGRFGFDYINHPQRLTVPLIRRDDAPKGAGNAVDPANPYTHFREATWEEALDRAAAGLKRIRDTNGPGALAGFGSAKGSNEEAYLFQKLVRTGFGTNNVDHCTRLCHASSVAALMECVGSGAVTATVAEVRHAEVIVVIGANPTVNHPVAATFIKNAAKRGAKLVVMDPRGSALTRHADYMLQFRAGADVTLLNSIMHVIVEEGLCDQQYIAGFTEGFPDVAAKVAAFAPEKMEGVTGIPAETVRTVARLYARAKTAMIFWGMGVSQHVHGTDNARCLISLALMTGQVGRPGTGLHPLRGQNNVQGASDVGLIPMLYPDYQSVEAGPVREKFEAFWGMELDRQRGLTVVEIMDAAYDGTIKGMYVMGENPAMSDPDLNHARAGLARLEHLVVQDLFLTETAYHADVVLPASAFPEKDGTFTNTDRRVQLGRAAVPLPGQARQDWQIIQEIARRIGLDWTYTHPREVFGEFTQVMASLKNITWERLERDGSVTYPVDGADTPGNEVVFGDGFPRAGGRGKFTAADVVPPAEVPDADYPIILTTGRQLEHWHTGAMTRRATVLDAIEPEAVAHVSPKELGRLGVAPGERIRVVTRRGQVDLMARADRDVPPGMVFIPFCYAEAAANLLTNPQLDPFGKIPEFKFCACRIEAAEAAQAAE